MKKSAAVLMLFLLLLSPASCQKSEDPVAELLAAGKLQLSNGEATLALKAFDEILARHDSEHREALFGAAFSEAISSFELLNMLTGLLAQVTQSLITIPEGAANQNAFISESLREIFKVFREKFLRACARYEKLMAGPDFSFVVKQIPAYLGVAQTAHLKGEFDKADVYILDSMARIFIFICDTILAQNLYGDFLGLYFNIQNLTSIGGLNAKTIFNVLAYLFNSNEKFLTLDPDVGTEMFNHARETLIRALEDIEQANAAIRAETDGQSNDIFIAGYNYRDEPVVKMRLFLPNLGTGELEANEIEIINERTLQAVARLKANLTASAGPVPWKDCLVPVLASPLTVAIGFGLLDVLDIDLKIGRESYSAEVIEALLNMFIPDVFGFDFGTFFSRPVGLRALFPQWTKDRPRGKNVLMMEWECPGHLDGNGFPRGSLGLICRDGDALTDTAHFVGTAHEIAADGLESGFPYILFPDPTFNGLLHIDVHPLNIPGYGDPAGLAPADLRGLNTVLSKVLPTILSLVGN